MPLAQWAHWLERREWALDFAGSSYAYPIVLAIHLSCIAVFGGMILMTNLRLLGWALTGYPIAEVLMRLRVWKRMGLLIMVTCGALLAGSEAGKYYNNPYFLIKMTLLALLTLHAFVFRSGVYRNAALDAAPAIPAQAKAAAILSLILWTGVLCAGRMIGYSIQRPAYAAPLSAASSSSRFAASVKWSTPKTSITSDAPGSTPQ